MKNKFPFKTINLINNTIKVFMFDDETNPDKKDGEAQGVAYCYYDKIYLHKGYPVSRIKQTFVHELLHIMDDTENVKDLSETQVDLLATKILYFLKHNKEVVNYLSEDE